MSTAPTTEVAVCAVEGCGRRCEAKGLCSMHYQRWRKSADPGPAEAWRPHGPSERHQPNVCVCDRPIPDSYPGQFARCWRPYEVRRHDRQAQMRALRTAWREFLISEGVAHLFPGLEVR